MEVGLMTDQNREPHDPAVRKDLASRLFRPNWPFFGSVRSRPSPHRIDRHPGATGQPPAGRGPIDVICAGMYRACSTWQYEVVAHLLERHCGGRRLGYLTGAQYAGLTRADTARTSRRGEPPDEWRIVKSHEGDRSFARAIAARRAIAVYSHRDVRDVTFSLMHKRGRTFEQVVRDGMIHQILANDQFWTAQPGVLVQRYDDLIADPVAAVSELAHHLGVAIEPGEVGEIARLYSAEANRARTAALRRRLASAGVDLSSAHNVQICDPTTLLHWNHMRPGKAASWRTATTSQRATLERLCGPWLRLHGYPPDESLPSRGVRTISVAGLRIAADLWAGRRTFLVRAASMRWPRAAAALKRSLGLPVDDHAGATAWADPTPATPVGQEDHADDARLRVQTTQSAESR
jgi:Sulfotransferase domain